MIYYTADLHLHYPPALSSRPFESVEEMDRTLIQNWNETVCPEDDVYLIGDIGYNEGHVPCRALSMLHGRKHLIRGNHDTGYLDAPLLYRYFETVSDFSEIEDGAHHIILSHYPMLHYKRGYMIHGHLHHRLDSFFPILKNLPRILNAGVDLNHYRPVPLRTLIENNRVFYDSSEGITPLSFSHASSLCLKNAKTPMGVGFHPVPDRPAPHPLHLFLTGKKHVGKSTVLRRLLEGRDWIPGGFLTVRRSIPEGHSIHMLRAGAKDDCTTENRLFSRMHQQFFHEPGAFDRLGCAILSDCGKADFLIMDELGPAEKDAEKFQQAILRHLDGNIPIYGVIQAAESPFLSQIRAHPNIRLISVTEENRDELPGRLLREGW